MDTLTQYTELSTNLQAELSAYADKPTKACSLRIRNLSNQLGKLGVHLRRDLVAADKAGK